MLNTLKDNGAKITAGKFTDKISEKEEGQYLYPLPFLIIKQVNNIH